MTPPGGHFWLMLRANVCKTKGMPLPSKCGGLKSDTSKTSLSEHILNRTGSEQCQAPMFVKPEASLFLASLVTCKATTVKGKFWSASYTTLARSSAGHQCL